MACVECRQRTLAPQAAIVLREQRVEALIAMPRLLSMDLDHVYDLIKFIPSLKRRVTFTFNAESSFCDFVRSGVSNCAHFCLFQQRWRSFSAKENIKSRKKEAS
jgi:hypothetical protein